MTASRASVDPGPRTDPAPEPAPWLVVVAVGQGRLAAELAALFDEDPRVRVIVDRRERPILLPRPAPDGPALGPP